MIDVLQGIQKDLAADGIHFELRGSYLDTRINEHVHRIVIGFSDVMKGHIFVTAYAGNLDNEYRVSWYRVNLCDPDSISKLLDGVRILCEIKEGCVADYLATV